ncbi:hypothetical protein CONLIGDRAFT_645055 [Coniochaeta ligniaria NRRL 30616]|uniref:Uncharacterized protein n=1 Tax=Coniochaeta ligniaria NRRL 30616 TaxID=1408157 RepID=A0A1J7J6I8_9PEZI|nr:hypothetical protein CONLIGDRAFT_645055 [Coniochaeta ligniaria NRRL 30616]
MELAVTMLLLPVLLLLFKAYCVTLEHQATTGQERSRPPLRLSQLLTRLSGTRNTYIRRNMPVVPAVLIDLQTFRPRTRVGRAICPGLAQRPASRRVTAILPLSQLQVICPTRRSFIGGPEELMFAVTFSRAFGCGGAGALSVALRQCDSEATWKLPLRNDSYQLALATLQLTNAKAARASYR